MKHGSGQWPTNGATIKQVDRVSDTCTRRYERQARRIVTLQADLKKVQADVNTLVDLFNARYVSVGHISPEELE